MPFTFWHLPSILGSVGRTVFSWPGIQTRHHPSVAKPTTEKTQLDHTAIFHPVVAELQTLIEQDADLYMAFHQMFEQIPDEPRNRHDPTGRPQIQNYHDLLSQFDSLLTRAPEFGDGEGGDLVPVPVCAMLNWPMNTPAGLCAFTNKSVNRQLKKILQQWARFLSTPRSRYVLTDDARGWFGPSARNSIPNFEQTFQCDPIKEYWGFSSWDDFFTRQFRPGVRPVHHPEDGSVIVNACESVTYKISSNVQAMSSFWLKGQPYSLSHMLNNDTLTPQFIGGTIYQAYLSALCYHRWHSPVCGQIVKIVHVSGTYCAISPSIEFDHSNPDSVGQSQAFLANLATRMLIFIEADNSDIGMMCFAAVGMVEVSSCEATVVEGQYVCKGDQLGMFHYGGSSYCLVLRPQTKVVFSEVVLQSLVDQETRVLLNCALAHVSIKS